MNRPAQILAALEAARSVSVDELAASLDVGALHLGGHLGGVDAVPALTEGAKLAFKA